MSLNAAPETNQIDFSDIKANIDQFINGTGSAAATKIEHKDVLREVLNELQPVNFRALAGAEEDEKLQQKYLIVLCIQELLKVI